MTLKAFNLLSVIQNINIKVHCLEASGNDLYIGSDDGLVVHYSVNEHHNDGDGSVSYSTHLVSQKSLANKKHISQLKAASALQRLLTLSEGNLFLLDTDVLNTVGSGPKIKNVALFCLNENPVTEDPFTVQLCVGKRRCIQLCSLNNDRMTLLREISLPDTPVNFAMDGTFVCVASQGIYSVVNVESGTREELFPYDQLLTAPHIKRIGKEEFLLDGPGNLGMFVTSAGISERPPIQWMEEVTGVAYHHPYIVTVSEQFVRIYSLIDQQLKQTFNSIGANIVGNFDGQLYIGNLRSVHCLLPLPWTVQVQALVDDDRVEEALELVEQSGVSSGISQEQYIHLLSSLLQKGAFVKLIKGEFEAAKENFLRGGVDVREVISLFPNLMPTDSTFTRCQPPLHNMADITQALQGDVERIEETKCFLLDFLVQLRDLASQRTFKMEMDTAIVKLLGDRNAEELKVFLQFNSDVKCCVADCVEVLLQKKQHCSLAHLYRSIGEMEKSLNIWTKLIRGEVTDDNFRGVVDIVDCLLSSSDCDLIWRYLDFILDRDPSEGTRLLTQTKAHLPPDHVLGILQRYPQIKLAYLHYLIHGQNLQDEKLHTELILHYIDEVNELMKETSMQEDLVNEVRGKLQQLLATVSYSAHQVLGRLQGTPLQREMVEVYGKLGEHERALSLLVHRLKDFVAADQYCCSHTQGSSRQIRAALLVRLLKLYLQPASGRDEDIELSPAIDLLTTHADLLEIKVVLSLLPSYWSLSIVQQYLRGALRRSLHQNRMQRLQQNLVSCENSQQKFVLHKLHNNMGPISLSSNCICCVCGKGFVNSCFTLYPNGVLTHQKCGTSAYVCPLTGTLFSAPQNTK